VSVSVLKRAVLHAGWRIWMLPVVAGVLAVTIGAQTAGASKGGFRGVKDSADEKPAVSHFAASPATITNADGYITLSAHVAHAESCALTAKPAVPGLPANFPCTTGEASDTVALPSNSSSKPRKYTFRLEVKGAGKTAKSPSLKVELDARAGTALLLGASQLAGGDSGACALLASRHVACWGDDSNGELGDGKAGGAGGPVGVLGVEGRGELAGISSVVGGAIEDYCAVMESTRVACWGEEGALGAGNVASREHCGSGSCDVPVYVLGPSGEGDLEHVLSLISVPDSGFCALLSSGGADCWGGNEYGQLGDGSFGASDLPVPVAFPWSEGTKERVIALIAQGPSVCATVESATAVRSLYCWGDNSYGQLGNGSHTASDSPQAVLGNNAEGQLTGVETVTPGNKSTSLCALLATGEADCWGYYPQLGDGPASGPTECFLYEPCATSPEPVLGLEGAGHLGGISAVADSASDYCATLTDAALDCWGNESDGELGNGMLGDGNSDIPQQVKGLGGRGTLTDVRSAVSSQTEASTCALLTDSDAACWGQGAEGELGNDHDEDSAYPVLVVGLGGGSAALGGVESIEPTGSGYCTILALGAVACWGGLDDGHVSAPQAMIG
jgi:hypothetical protein